MASLIREPFGSPVLMRKAYGEALVELGRSRSDVVVLSADVNSSDFSSMFEQAFPDRFINVGIAEPALVDVAVGLANGGFVPIANTLRLLICHACSGDGTHASVLRQGECQAGWSLRRTLRFL